MKTEQELIDINRASGAAVGFLIASMLFVLFVVLVRISVKVPEIDAARAAERAKDLAEIRATAEKSLTTAAWIDQSRGIVRVPIETAMQIAAHEWQNPTEARSNLMAREKKASAPAPAAPAKANPFE